MNVTNLFKGEICVPIFIVYVILLCFLIYFIYIHRVKVSESIAIVFRFVWKIIKSFSVKEKYLGARNVSIALGIIIFLIIALPCLFQYHNKMIRFNNPEIVDIYVLNFNDTTAKVVDSLRSVSGLNEKVSQLKLAKDKGLLLTPQEYTNNIVSYYNTIIVVLIGIITALTIFGAIQIKLIVRRSIEKDILDILSDTKFVANNIAPHIKGVVDDRVPYVVEDTLESMLDDILKDLDDRLDEVNNKIKILDEMLDAANQEDSDQEVEI